MLFADGLHVFVRLSIQVGMLFDCVSSVRELCTFYLFLPYSHENHSHRCHDVKGKTQKLCTNPKVTNASYSVFTNVDVPTAVDQIKQMISQAQARGHPAPHLLAGEVGPL